MTQDRYELPKGWTWTTLERCIDVLDSQRIPINNDERNKRLGNIPYYGATGQVGWINDFLFNEELLLLGEDGAPFFERGKTKAYIINGKSWVNNHAHVLRAIANITSNRFLCYYLNIFDYHEYVNGTTRLKLTQGAMNRMPIPLPTLQEQKRIVVKVEKLLERVNKIREELTKLPLLIKKFRQSVLAKAFQGELTKQDPKDEPASTLLERINKERQKLLGKKYKEPEPVDTTDLPDLPEGWEWTRLGNVCGTTSGGTPLRSTEDYYGGSINWIKSGELEDGIITKAEETITEKGLKNSSAKIFPKGTLLIALYGATVGKTGLLDIDAATNQAVCGIFSPDSIIQLNYLWYYLKSKRDDLIGKSFGGAQPNISQEIVRDLKLPLPPYNEQKRIVEKIENYFARADEIAKAVEEAQKHSDRMTQSILSKAFRGELVPQDPSDKPASVLLERIKSEKSKSSIRPKTPAK